MKSNLGSIDRIIRLLIAAVLIYLFASGTVPGTPGIVLLAAGVVLIITSLVRFCPIYFAFGISSDQKKTASMK